MVAELWSLLVHFTVAVSIAVALIAIMRPVATRFCGAPVAYNLWVLVPALALTAIVPGPAAYDPVVATTATVLHNVSRPIGASVLVVTSLATGFQRFFVVTWGVGALAFLGVACLRQRRYWQSLGKVTRDASGVLRAERAISPALVGVFRPLLLLPANFEDFHTEVERKFMLAHEDVHRRRADPLANAFGELIRGLQWFNPVAHWGCRTHRQDQEVSCDSIAAGVAVEQRTRYAELLVKTHLAPDGAIAPPLGASWHPIHPLTARLSALRRRVPSRRLSKFGHVVVGLTTLSLTYGGWTLRAEAAAADGGPALVALHISWSVELAPKGSETTGDIRKFSMITDTVVSPGASLQLFHNSSTGAHEYQVSCTPKILEPPAGAKRTGQIWIGCDLRRHDGSLLGSPQLITADNQDATVEIGGSDGQGGKLLYRLTINPSTAEWRIKQAEAAQKAIRGT